MEDAIRYALIFMFPGDGGLESGASSRDIILRKCPNVTRRRQ